jgi:hypothetical protein
VIKFRKIVVDAIETALNGGTPKGIVDKKQATAVYRLDTQVGVRTKGIPLG